MAPQPDNEEIFHARGDRAMKPKTGPLTETQTETLRWEFHLAASGEWGNTRKMKRLIARGAPVNAQDDAGWSALHYAANEGRFGSVRVLVEAGAQIDMREGNNMTAFMRAAYNGHNDIAALLAKQGADVFAKDDKGHTSIMLAAGEGYMKTVRYLACLGLDISATADDGETARSRALSKRQNEIADFLAQEELLKSIAAGVPPTKRLDGLTALHYAVKNGELSDVRKALKAGVAVDARDDNGATPLLTASAADFRLGVVSLLLKKGANVKAADAQGRTALMIAAGAGACDILHLLLKNGAAPDATDRAGRTAASYALDNGYPRLAEELLEAAAAHKARTSDENIRAATTLARPLPVGGPLRFR
jgi:ankyrin repeat protein